MKKKFYYKTTKTKIIYLRLVMLNSVLRTTSCFTVEENLLFVKKNQ